MKLWDRIKVALFWNKFDATDWSQFRSWRSTPLQDARLDLTKASREVLQAKSRDWERNSPLYRKLANTWEQYTVGTGIRLPSASSNPEWNIVADQVMEEWEPIADLENRFGWFNDQGIISRARFVDGEHFIVLTNEGPYPRIQLVEGHRCATPPDRKSEEGKTIIDGVKVNEFGRAVGYWFLAGDKFKLVDASLVIHVFNPERAGLPRGIPECTSALNVLHDLDDLRTLEMRAAKDAAELSTIYKTATGEMPSTLVSMAQMFQNTNTAAGSSSSVTDARREFYKNATGGRNVVLFQGDDAIQHVPERPGANTREYWRLLAGEVCAAAGIPLALVYPDSMQGTVYRGALDAAAAAFRNETTVLAGYFTRVRNYVIQNEARFNKDLNPLPPDWRKVTFGTVRSPNVDIGRNSQARIAELAAGLTDWNLIAAELGLDGKQILKSKADMLVYIQQLCAERPGLTPEMLSSQGLPQPEPQIQTDITQ